MFNVMDPVDKLLYDLNISIFNMDSVNLSLLSNDISTSSILFITSPMISLGISMTIVNNELRQCNLNSVTSINRMSFFHLKS